MEEIKRLEKKARVENNWHTVGSGILTYSAGTNIGTAYKIHPLLGVLTGYFAFTQAAKTAGGVVEFLDEGPSPISRLLEYPNDFTIEKLCDITSATGKYLGNKTITEKVKAGLKSFCKNTHEEIAILGKVQLSDKEKEEIQIKALDKFNSKVPSNLKLLTGKIPKLLDSEEESNEETKIELKKP